MLRATPVDPTVAHTVKTHLEIINWLIERNGYAAYLEIGVGDGSNLVRVNCAKKIGVDPVPHETTAGQTMVHQTSDQFFAENRDRFDLVFIDGLHHADVVERDITHALAALRPGGAIVVHDLNPHAEIVQRVPRVSSLWTGDCWKAWVRIRRQRADLLMVVADTDHGVGVILPQAACSSRPISVSDEEMTWENFARHRRAWLNLVPPNDLPKALFGKEVAEWSGTT